MLKRDFIMVQIEELGKALARLVFNRKSGKDLDKNPDLIEQALNQDDGCGLQRLELAAKLLIEDSYVSSLPFPLLNKAQELLYYLQIHDSTYSVERMMLLQEVEHELSRRG